LQLQIGYALAPHLCKSGSHVSFYVLSAVCAAIAVVGGMISYRDWRRVGRGSPDDTDGGAAARTRFLGALGVLVSVNLLLAIVAQFLTILFFDPCWT
jgi:hypothetical protein